MKRTFMRNLPLPRQRLLNASLVAAFGTATALWGLCAAAQTADAPPAGTAPVTGQSGQTLAPVTVNSETESSATSRVNGYVAKRSATGTKTDTPIIETPQSISVVTADRISSLGVTRLSDALAYTAGVKMLDGLDSRFDWITLRGFDAYSPGFYLDGMQLRNNSNYAVWRLEGYGAERIEVLRGPSSVLYGQTGPGRHDQRGQQAPDRGAGCASCRCRSATTRETDRGRFLGPDRCRGQAALPPHRAAARCNTAGNYAADDRSYIAPSLTWKPSSDTSLTLLSHYTRTSVGNYLRLPAPAGRLAAGLAQRPHRDLDLRRRTRLRPLQPGPVGRSATSSSIAAERHDDHPPERALRQDQDRLPPDLRRRLRHPRCREPVQPAELPRGQPPAVRQQPRAGRRSPRTTRSRPS
jgi:iron complex outermembrane receptor protein